MLSGEHDTDITVENWKSDLIKWGKLNYKCILIMHTADSWIILAHPLMYGI